MYLTIHEKNNKDSKWYSLQIPAEGFIHLDPMLDSQNTKLNFSLPNRKPLDILFYIYTSGTTGLPKASIIRHLRFCRNLNFSFLNY